jgi:hypothetical protein
MVAPGGGRGQGRASRSLPLASRGDSVAARRQDQRVPGTYAASQLVFGCTPSRSVFVPSSPVGECRCSIRPERALRTAEASRIQVPRTSREVPRCSPRGRRSWHWWWSTRTRPKAATRELPEAGAHRGSARIASRVGLPSNARGLPRSPCDDGPRTRDEIAPVKGQGMRWTSIRRPA